MSSWGPDPPRYVKDWERQGGRVINNPNFVSLRECRTWRPRKYTSYLWVLKDQDSLYVGIETQVAREHTVSKDAQDVADRYKKGPTQQGYGHPTLTGGGDALYGGELLFHGGRWLINSASGRYGRSQVAVFDKTRLRQAQRLFKALIGLSVEISTYEVGQH